MLQSSQMKMKNCRPQAAHNTFTDLTHVRQKRTIQWLEFWTKMFRKMDVTMSSFKT